MVKKIYNLIFSTKERSYQQEAYAALGFRESYRGWLVIVFSISWLVSIWMFQIGLWSIIFLAPFYALLLFLAYEGRTGAMILLIVFWLIEKINNFPYLFFDYYKLIIVIILGLIFLPVAFNALKIEFVRGVKESAGKNKKIFKLIMAGLSLMAFWLAGWLIYHYYPFIQHRGYFALEHKEGQTMIKNKNFKISFAVTDACRLDSDVLNHLIDYSLWAGQLRCQKSGDFTMFIVSEGQASPDWELIDGFDGIYSYDRGKMWNIIITPENSQEKLVIGGYDYNKNFKEQILSSIKYN